MNCRQVSELLEQHTDRELSGARATVIDAHLDNCPACKAAHSELLAVCEALDGYPRIKASPDFDMRVLDAVLPQLAQSDSFFDRLDAIFARPLYKLLGSGAFGAGIGLLILMALSPATPSPDGSMQTPATPMNPMMAGLNTTQALRQYYSQSQWQTALIGSDSFEWSHEPAQLPASKPPRPAVSTQEKTSWDANTSALPSSSLPGSLC